MAWIWSCMSTFPLYQLSLFSGMKKKKNGGRVLKKRAFREPHCWNFALWASTLGLTWVLSGSTVECTPWNSLSVLQNPGFLRHCFWVHAFMIVKIGFFKEIWSDIASPKIKYGETNRKIKSNSNRFPSRRRYERLNTKDSRLCNRLIAWKPSLIWLIILLDTIL